MKVIFLVPYPYNSAPSQRFRFEQYLPFLEEKRIRYELHSFIDSNTWNLLYKKGRLLKKAIGIVGGFIKRVILLFKIVSANRIFIHREASPIGPPIFERIIAKVLRKKIIYDFDDAIWLANTSGENKAVGTFKFHSKTALICKWSYRISVGNEFLADYAKRFNHRVVINPTTIDTDHYHDQLKNQYSTETVIGWTGSHSTLKYLDLVIPALERLEAVYNFTFMVIADKDPKLQLKSYRFLRWSKETENEDLLQFNIGLMPLTDDPWSQGKCGFKALQYMALGIPAVASPVGVNKIIIDQGSNGFLCQTEEEWFAKLRLLVREPHLRFLMGKKGRMKVEQHYSVKSNKDNFLSLFD